MKRGETGHKASNPGCEGPFTICTAKEFEVVLRKQKSKVIQIEEFYNQIIRKLSLLAAKWAPN